MRVGKAIYGVLGALSLCSAPALAQSDGAPKTIAIGAFTSVKECTYYQESAGSDYSASAGVVAANRYGFVAGSASESYSTWRTWWVKDCVDHFASLKSTLRATLASAGHGLVVANAGAQFTISGAISDIRSTSQSMRQRGVSDDRNAWEVTFSLVVKDRNGRAIAGQTINKSIDLDRSIAAGGFASDSSVDGEGLYTALEKEVALAAARYVAFRFNPIRLQSVSGQKIVLNYGAPLLDNGDLVQLISPDGRLIKFTVQGSAGGQSVASVEGRQDISSLNPGAVVEYVDPSSPSANGRRFERVDLP